MSKKQYARISGYGDILVPLSMLEKFINEAYIARTDYTDNHEIMISEVHPIKEFKVHDAEEIRSVQAQMILEGKSKD